MKQYPFLSSSVTPAVLRVLGVLGEEALVWFHLSNASRPAVPDPTHTSRWGSSFSAALSGLSEGRLTIRTEPFTTVSFQVFPQRSFTSLLRSFLLKGFAGGRIR
jgi:hypothetical protein